jgi:hypothetical protein
VIEEGRKSLAFATLFSLLPLVLVVILKVKREVMSQA